MVNTNRRELQPGEQAYYCYGHRSNKFLLVNYGFCFADNNYESFMFNLNTKLPQIEIPFMVALKPQKAKEQVQEIRLKTN